jgi:SAM-dependent methyltransferase
MTPLTQRELLHRHGADGSWGNLGLWPATDYAAACSALAWRVAEAASLAPGQRVLGVACGAGDELALWVRCFGIAHALGVERDAEARGLAQGLVGDTVAVTDALPAGPLSIAERFDAVLCVDAAYHLSPRPAILAQWHAVLKPGGRLAFTDLVLDGRRSLPLRAAARLCGVPAGDLVRAEVRRNQLRDAGFIDVRIEQMDSAVLDGFAQFVRAQRGRLGPLAAGPAWRRVAMTAALIPPCRALGLGYALFSARRPRRGR